VRLTAAGEVLSALPARPERRSRAHEVADRGPQGLRRGTVRIACSQALALDFLPRQIAEFRKTHPLVSFDLKVADHEWAMAALAAYEVDLVMVFRPPFLANFQP
jgi:DNA-binding transcriptional LysR family regulator